MYITHSYLVDLITHLVYDHLRPICRPKSSPPPLFFTLPPTAHVFLSTCNCSSRDRMWLASKAAERRIFSQTYWSLRQTVDFLLAFVFFFFQKEHTFYPIGLTRWKRNNLFFFRLFHFKRWVLSLLDALSAFIRFFFNRYVWNLGGDDVISATSSFL